MGKSGVNDIVVTWSPSYATGIRQIDDQHKELITITNMLYKSCLTDNSEGLSFREAMQRMVEYVVFHFSAEIELLKRTNYPDILNHKKQHEGLVKNILDAVKNYEDGKNFVPNTFVRTLKDWVFSHIAVSDREYASYIADQKKKGLLSDSRIER